MRSRFYVQWRPDIGVNVEPISGPVDQAFGNLNGALWSIFTIGSNQIPEKLVVSSSLLDVQQLEG